MTGCACDCVALLCIEQGGGAGLLLNLPSLCGDGGTHKHTMYSVCVCVHVCACGCLSVYVCC